MDIMDNMVKLAIRRPEGVHKVKTQIDEDILLKLNEEKTSVKDTYSDVLRRIICAIERKFP